VLRTQNAVMNLGFVMVFPFTFLSNLFVDPGTMPSWLRAVIDANPITHLVMAERGLMAGAVSRSEVLWVLLAAAILTAVFAPLTIRLFQRRN
jgi:ABC-2 type transport system permease protein